MPCHKRFTALFFILCSLFLTTPVYADWFFNADLPNCGITPFNYYTPGSTPYPTITVSSSSTDLSSLRLDASPLPVTCGTPPTSLSLPQTVTTAPFSITCQWNTTGLSNDYTFTITALNKSGNTKSCTAIYQQGTGPWLKTTSGDVHSNTRINAPNGP